MKRRPKSHINTAPIPFKTKPPNAAVEPRHARRWYLDTTRHSYGAVLERFQLAARRARVVTRHVALQLAARGARVVAGASRPRVRERKPQPRTCGTRKSGAHQGNRRTPTRTVFFAVCACGLGVPLSSRILQLDIPVTIQIRFESKSVDPGRIYI